jgi:NAD(P)-dependent dehydrogenase (short-subunit alcohol dehydrogenase family)
MLAQQVRSIVGDRLDVLVSNAGVSKAALIVDYTVEDFDKLFAVNVRSPFFLVQQLLPVLGDGSNIFEMTNTTPEQNKALVLEAFDTLINKRDYAAAERFWSPHYIQHSAHIEPGREGLFNLIRSLPATLKIRSLFRIWRKGELDCR